MNKASSKIKELLHLVDMFTPDSQPQDVSKILMDSGVNDNYFGSQFQEWISKFDTFPINHPMDYCFVGGKNKSMFFLQLNQSTNQYWIYCPDGSDLKKSKEDLPLLKDFLKNRYKMVVS